MGFLSACFFILALDTDYQVAKAIYFLDTVACAYLAIDSMIFTND